MEEGREVGRTRWKGLVGEVGEAHRTCSGLVTKEGVI